MKKYFKKRSFRSRRGVVLMVVLTTIVFLTVVTQQMMFDTAVEFKSGSSHLQGLKAYHAAKSGLEITLLKILIYKKIQKVLSPQKTNSDEPSFLKTLSDQVQPLLVPLWKASLIWPPPISDDLSELRKGEIQEQTQESFFSDVSYQVEVESENSKLNINDMASPHSTIRVWASSTLLRLMSLLRNKEPWLSHNYNEQELSDIVDSLQKHLDPTTSYIEDSAPFKRRLMSLDELLLIPGMSSEWLEFLRPYITVHSSGGLHLQFAKPPLLQSLQDDITDQQIEDLSLKLSLENTEDSVFLSNLDQTFNSFAEEGIFIRENYQIAESNFPALGHLVFNFDAPQDFQIKATGISAGIKKTLLVTVHDPYYSIDRIYTLMQSRRDKSGYTPPDLSTIPRDKALSAPMINITEHPSTPFIIEWKEVHSH